MVDIPTQPRCPMCGLLHPVIPGKPCTAGVQKTTTGQVIDYSGFFSSLKTILISQFEKKKIKNPKKFFGYALVRITKLLEEYNE